MFYVDRFEILYSSLGHFLVVAAGTDINAVILASFVRLVLVELFNIGDFVLVVKIMGDKEPFFPLYSYINFVSRHNVTQPTMSANQA